MYFCTHVLAANAYVVDWVYKANTSKAFVNFYPLNPLKQYSEIGNMP